MVSGPPTTGVIYDRNVFPGFWRRVAIAMLDLAVVGIASAVLAAVVSVLLPEVSALRTAVIGSLVLAGFYFVVLKRTAVRTVGYRLFRVKIVDLRGEKPTLFQMLSRFAFLVIGPLNGIVDLIWITSSESRRALRDMLSQTYVVPESALPVGSAPIRMQRYDIMGIALVFAEVAAREDKAP